ncbi:MAG: Holliday junction resolvase RuvX [Candidatus Eisenbacteria bacterium]|nr:Holliday junction resolvase RuvX [Candidatus Eisenbacteria bacterium]
MGVDFGEKRFGISISDPGGVVAGSPSVVEAATPQEAVVKIKEIVEKEGVTEIVVGYPVSLRGGAGPQAAKAAEFGALLSKGCGKTVSLWDERYSTVEAQRLLQNLSKKVRRQKQKRDAVAAMLILQSYLDRKSSGPAPAGADPAGAEPA